MKYTEFREMIRSTLEAHPEGKTWRELRDELSLPYRNPCPDWVKRLEEEIGLDRTEKRGNSLVWRIC